jgi:glycosyltransferase involved in cell wall biosynthesis
MKNKPKIALVGSRGIPPRYGGAETFVYELSKRLKEYFDIYVTCESDHFGIDEYEGIKRVHIWAKHALTTIPILYDIIATFYLLKKVKDIRVIYYVAPDGVFASIIPKIAKKKVIINTDGIEWKRLLIRMHYVNYFQKVLYLTVSFLLLLAEFLACKLPDITIADSIAIKKYLEHRWRAKRVQYISYGVRTFSPVSEQKQEYILAKLSLKKFQYYLTIARLVAENGLHMEIEAFKNLRTNYYLVIVGPINIKDPYFNYLLNLKDNCNRILFVGGIYDNQIVYTLRANCRAYIHPYQVGGTNPSLLEQLQFNRPIVAYDVPFHREILRENGLYFKDVKQLEKILIELSKDAPSLSYQNVIQLFSWEFIVKRYKELFLKLID